jgi:alpha,alpha-trehalase
VGERCTPESPRSPNADPRIPYPAHFLRGGSRMTLPPDYPPIESYGLIGNRHTCALVGLDGAIEWCCLPHLDSPSIFASVLDRARGGHWRIAPAAESAVTRRYVGPSSVLDTLSRCDGGVLLVRDFLPIRRGRGEEASWSFHSIMRIVRCEEGEVEVAMQWAPRPNYARDDVTLYREGTIVEARAAGGSVWLSGLPENGQVRVEGATVHLHIRLRAGEALHLVTSWGDPLANPEPVRIQRYLDNTLAWWDDWSNACCTHPGAEEWRDLVLRSGMVLKLLTNERTGAIAAAPTTSLPEEIGGVRNWDYRFCWVRDASLITQALVALGRREDGIAFLRFLETAAAQHRDPARVQVLYGLNGETHLPEYNLGHLDGYRDSRPVRIGNAAALQRQLDVYGELLQAAYDLLLIGVELTPEQWGWLRGVADYVCQTWRLKDRGIWEVRGPERHFTYSKLMCWVALDRSLRIAARLGWTEGTALWRSEREAIRAAIMEQGYDRSLNSFVQSFGGKTLDASNLLIARVGFLPAAHPMFQGTIEATLRDLTVNGLVYRYLAEEAPDGVSGGEGAFGLCTFWLADALSLSGRVEEARSIFEGMLGRANDLGLFAEEIDPVTGAFLGNFPQAFTHVGLIDSAQFLGRAMRGEMSAGEEHAGEEPLALDGDMRG